MKLLFLSLVATCVTYVNALSPAEWRSQSVYQVLTDRFARTDGSTTAACNTVTQDYCGGTWQGIINQLDYIQGVGFTAIWISPVVENAIGLTSDGSGYHGYWAQDIYSLNANFGTAADLKALSAALHARGMYLMVDVVTNHMGYIGCGTCVDYGVFNPFNSQSYFHPFCLIDYGNSTSIKVCWEGDNTVSLPDMRTEEPDVSSIWNSWITGLISNYSIDGLRVDSAQQVNNDFFPPFETAAGVYLVGEIYNGDPAYVCPYQSYMSGVLNYPAYYWISQAFESTSGNMNNLANGLNTMISDCVDTTLLGSFTENHDVPRFASYTSDLSQAKNVIAFTLLSDGIPIIYTGQEQHYSGGSVPSNREATWLSNYNTTSVLYTWTAALNKLRKQVIAKDSTYVTYKATSVYTDSSTIVTRKGATGSQLVAVFSNKGESGSSYNLILTSAETGFTATKSLIEVMGCTAYTADSSGNLVVAMASGLPRVFYPKSLLLGSGICASLTGSATTTSPTAWSTATTCTAATSVVVTFNELKTTIVGETVKISGNNSILGNWATGSAVALSASAYTSSNPLWSGTISFAAGTVIQYKYIVVESSGSVIWEADPNHIFMAPASCAATAMVNNTWQT